MILSSPLPRIHYHQNKQLQVKESSTSYQPTVEPLPHGVQTQQLFQEKEELGQTKFPVTLFFTIVELCSCATCVTFYGPQNNPYICLGL